MLGLDQWRHSRFTTTQVHLFLKPSVIFLACLEHHSKLLSCRRSSCTWCSIGVDMAHPRSQEQEPKLRYHFHELCSPNRAPFRLEPKQSCTQCMRELIFQQVTINHICIILYNIIYIILHYLNYTMIYHVSHFEVETTQDLTQKWPPTQQLLMSPTPTAPATRATAQQRLDEYLELRRFQGVPNIVIEQTYMFSLKVLPIQLLSPYEVKSRVAH